MKAYYYTPEQLNMESYPDGQLRLDQELVESTTIPAQADLFVIPAGFHAVPDEVLYNLPYWDLDHDRHVILNVSDSYKRFTNAEMMIFRCDTTARVLKENPWTIPLAWPVEDLMKYTDYKDWEYDVSFVGWRSTMQCRQALMQLKNSTLRSKFVTYSEFYGYLSKERQDARRQPFIDSMVESRMSLCVRSIPAGVIRYRFYEAMTVGNIPIHINDGRVYPFSDKIDYDRFTLQVPQDQIGVIASLVQIYLDEHTDDDIASAGAYARDSWLEWLNADDWSSRITQQCIERLEDL